MSFPFPRPFPGPSMVSWGVLSLFSSGEQGAWYDPSDFSTMFQDAAGATPVTAVEQPVGLLLDKSKGLTLGAELVTNGDFASDSDWTKGTGWTIGSGVASSDGSQASSSNLSQSAGLVNGKTYKVTFTVSNRSAGAFRPVVGGGGAGSFVSANGTFTQYVVCVAGPVLYLQADADFVGSIDNISVRELPGNHASQSTAASRPVLSARVNLLTYSEQFDNAAWTKSNCSVTATNIIDPLGGSTADEVTLSAGTAGKYIGQTVTAQTVTQTFSVCIKAGTHTFLQILNNGDVEWFANVNASTGALGNTGTRTSSSIISLGNGWYCITLAFTPGTPGTGWRIYGVDSNTAIYGASTASTGTFSIWGADLRVTNDGVGIPAYQRVAAATDYDTSGFPLYLKFDGVDDSLATGTIDPGSVDKAQVFAGVRKLSDLDGIIAELSVTTNANAGAFYFASQPSGKFAVLSRGSAATSAGQEATVSGYSAPVTAVLCGTMDISGDRNLLRANGVAGTPATADQGTGNYLAYPLYIGRRGGATVPLNSNLYSLILRFSAANLSDAQIASTETYVNNLTKAY